MSQPEDFIPYLPAGGALLALGCVIGAMRAARKQRLIDGLPTCKTTGVFIGEVEVQGTAEADSPLLSCLAETACVHFAWSVEERWSRTVTETYTDNDGKAQTRTREESGWTTVADGGEQIPFYVRDDCGLLLVRPAGAKVEPQVVFDETCGRSDPLYYGKGPAPAVANSDHRRRFREVAIPLHAPVFVIGKARERQDVVAAEIAQDRAAALFLISTRNEKQVSRGYATTYWALLVLGLFLCTSGFGAGLASRWPGREQVWIPFLLGAAAFGALGAMAWSWMAYNSLVDLRNRVASAWSQVDVQLKRRVDLIPRLESVIRGLQQHERTVQESAAALRTQAQATAPGVAGPDFAALAPTLTAVIENYPQLKTSAAFLELQKQLVDTEQRIALARGYFNELATHFNTRLEVVPDRFLAALTGLSPQALMAANDFERAPVPVKVAN